MKSIQLTYYLLALILVMLAALSFMKTTEFFARSTIYDHPTKCFSCEQDAIARFGPEWGWLGQDTKSFSAEREMIRRTGDIAAAIDTHPIRYY